MINNYVAPGYEENSLLWDREDGTIFPRVAPRPGDGITFHENWGVDCHLDLPRVPAHLVNRYIDALKFAAKNLAAYSLCRHAGSEFDPDEREIVYYDGYKPYRDAFNAVIDTVFPYRYIDVEIDGRNYPMAIDVLEDNAEKNVGRSFEAAEHERRVAAEKRRLRAEAVRSLIAPWDVSYTKAAPGQRYTRIRVDLSTGHLSAHTADEPAAALDGAVHEWAVPDLNAQQANRVMKAIGADALRIARPQDPAVIAPDAWERIRQVLEGLAPTEVEVTAALDGAKDTPARREQARRRLVTARVKSL
ncbi:hypothetical protein AB0M72_06835 [Nocardiopsis dassonvillei]